MRGEGLMPSFLGLCFHGEGRGCCQRGVVKRGDVCDITASHKTLVGGLGVAVKTGTAKTKDVIFSPWKKFIHK